MPRVKIDLPETFSFTTRFPVQITDLNYGGHVGNDRILSYAHEARMRFLVSLGYSELQLAGVSLIMADAAIVYKNELYYGDDIIIHIQPVECSRVGFDLIYRMEKKVDDQTVMVSIVKTAMVCFDYTLKKVTALPEAAKNTLFP